MALVSVLAFFNFGTFHRVRYPHHSELFHYVLGSKYFPELGYDGLYVASLQAQQEQAPSYPWPDAVRDLRTNDLVVDRAQLADHQREVRARFDDSRWQAFVADHQYFLDHSHPAYVAAMRKDHGYNPTPAWTAMARLMGGWLQVGWGSLLLLTLLDPLLLLVMFAVVWRTFGFPASALSVTVFGLAFLSRFHWVGGSFLRHDWLCAAVVGVCMIKRDKPVAAGVALGYAAALRIFPALLLFGVAVWALRRWRQPEARRWAILLAASLVGTLVCCFLIGMAAGRGLEGWREFADAISLHRLGWSRNRVGLFNSMVFVFDTLARPFGTLGEGRPHEQWLARVADFRATWWPLRFAIVGLGLAVVARAAWARGRLESAVLGLVVIYVLTEPTCYYWSLLLLIPLIERRQLTVLVLGYSAVLSVIGVTPGAGAVYAMASHLMLMIFVAWLLPGNDGPGDEPEGSQAASGGH
jgi:hypothetical protein